MENSIETQNGIGRGFPCPVCPKSFEKDQGLLDHLLKDHMNSFLKQSDQPKLLSEQVNDQPNLTDDQFYDQPNPTNVHHNLVNDQFNDQQPNFTNDHNSLIDKQVDDRTEVLNVKTEPMDESSVEPLSLKIESVKSEVETEVLVKCQLCPQRFGQRAILNNHLMIDHLNKKFECPECGQDHFKGFASLGLHIRKIHGKKSEFKCHICIIQTKEFTSSSTLIRHYLTKHLKLDENPSGLLGRSGQIGPSRQFGQWGQVAPFRPSEQFGPNEQFGPIGQFRQSEPSGQFGPNGQFGLSGVDLNEQNRAIGQIGLTGQIEQPKCHFKCQICGLEYFKKKSFYSHMRMKHSREKVNPIEEGTNKTIEGDNKLSENQDYHTMKFEKNQETEGSIENPECAEMASMDHYGFLGSSVKQCKLCGQEYLGSLTQHLLVDHLVRTFDCDYCGIELSNFSRLARHIKTMHPKQPIFYRCHICDNTKKSFVNSSSLVTHLLKSHLNLKSLKEAKVEEAEERSKEFKAEQQPMSKLQCELCGIEVDSIRQRTHHYLTQHLKMKFKCQICGYDCKDFHALAMHKMKHHPGLPKNLYNCDFCPHTYANSSALKVHLFNVHLKLRLYKCELCGKEYGTNMTLRQHYQTTHVANFDCKLCGQQIKTRTKLSTHIEKEHELRCHKCFKQYENRSNLYHHLRADCSSNQQMSIHPFVPFNFT